MTPQSTFDRQPSHNAFVGRERELAELRAGLDDAIAGRGCLFLISGEPGIGKTHLAEEISKDASARAMRVVWGRCWEGGGAPAYWPFIQILRSCVDERDSEKLETILGSGASEIARLIPEVKRSLPSLEEAKTATDSESARFRLFDAVATLLKNVARSGPLLMVVDDLHDADQPSLQMLRFVARETKGAHILIVGTYRDAEVRQSPELGRLIGDLIREGRTVPLAGLSQGEVGEFLERSAGHETDDKLITDLYYATDGNPLFVDGVVRLLIAEGKFARAGAAGRDRFKIPDGVRESIRKRVAALSVETNSLLSVASVIGDEFDTRLLESVSKISAEQIVDRIDEAAQIGIVTKDATGHACHRFAHELIRGVLYESMAASPRTDAHRWIAAAIEELYHADLTPHLAALAHHYGRAGIADRAIDYLIRAGEAAAAVFAYEDTTQYWLAAFETMKEHNYVPEPQARLLVRLGNLRSAMNLSDSKGVEILEQALKIYESLGRQNPAAKVHSHLGGILSSFPSAIVDIPKAMEHYRQAEEVLSQGQDRRSLAAVYTGLAQVAIHLNRTGDGLAWSQRAMDFYERIGDEDFWPGAATIHAIHLFSRGRLAEALSIMDRAYATAEHSSWSASHSPSWVAGAIRDWLLDPSEARAWYLRELAKPRVAQVPSRRRILLDALANSYMQEGEWAEARKVATKFGEDREERVRDYDAHGVNAALAFCEGQWEQAESAPGVRLPSCGGLKVFTRLKTVCALLRWLASSEAISPKRRHSSTKLSSCLLARKTTSFRIS
jgi:tetratricopeptide (TPR) repeat protein